METTFENIPEEEVENEDFFFFDANDGWLSEEEFMGKYWSEREAETSRLIGY